ncbi:type I-C CRISPR-associated protein Cas8c/Csd1 [uncultured Thiothrix sp.]|uniref:type I-C CRISPR-associated protein Cas8c/Csd1 n=1 Tax=uncultured Thiothrix sp. TaxID=223185 RepID=UPI00262B8604|nr:type I-C CRISPR-associated protein Cas8c/Csd1 [uncultured Thiothrix sp.]HMT94291.1 type I-C CRISPR-associated protein Cas8c/Csd1 [Thiolinea sp.]
MILQALYKYYHRKAQDPESALAPAGFEYKEIPFILELREDGTLNQIEDTRYIENKKKRAKSERVPQGVKKTSGVAANLLWDNAEYVLGLDTKGKPERVKEQQVAFLEKIRALNLADTDKGIAAVIYFLESLDLAIIQQNPLWEEIEKTNPNLTFRLQGQTHLVCQSRPVQAAIANGDYAEAAKAICLITGEIAEIERLHPAIKGVWGAQTAGANIISFNLDAFRSFGKQQSFNAPVSKEAAFAYTTALNHLLGKDSKQRMQVGDASTVFWASKRDGLEDSFAAIWGASSSKDDPDRNTQAVKSVYEAVEKHGRSPALDEQTVFYVLGLAPNAARISVRFWYMATVREISQRIVQHFNDLEIERSAWQEPYLPLWKLLKSIALLGKTENIPPELAGEVMRRILAGLPYPETLLASAIRRNHAEQNVTYERAAIIKACLNRNYGEGLDVKLDTDNTHIGYRLGRLFAILEKLQAEAHDRKLSADVADKYYSSASTNPINAFPVLIKLHKHHLNKLRKQKFGRAVQFDQWLGELFAGLNAPSSGQNSIYPKTLSLAEQGNFSVGYYHQRQFFFTKDDENVTSNTKNQGDTE